MMRYYFVCLLLLPGYLFAQETLSLETVLAWAMTEHPLAEIADAVAARGPLELRKARGAFDPKLAVNYDRKDFKGTEYFDIGEAGLEWQSPFALKFAAGYQVTEGTFLNPERTLPDQGQAYLAIKLPLLQGLFTDAARTGRRQGEIAQEYQRALARVIRNELRYDVITRYANWLYTENALAVAMRAENLIQVRLQNTRELFRQGDKPAVDTLEASISLNQQQLQRQQARVEANLARQALNELYWPLDRTILPEIGNLNLNLNENTIPAGWQDRHPELRELQLLISNYQLEQRLKREQLKPRLDLSYYLLGDGFELPSESGDAVGGPFTQNYKLGITASYPILNRKASASVQLGELKIQEAAAKLQGKQQALDSKVAAYAEAANFLAEQFTAAEQLSEQRAALLAAEQELFRLGESTQFLLNSREQSWQKALLQVEKIRFSRLKTLATYRYLLADW